MVFDIDIGKYLPGSLTHYEHFKIINNLKKGITMSKIFMATEFNRRLLEVPEAAEYLGLSKSTLDKWRCYGEGPKFIKMGSRAIRYRLSDLDDYIASRQSSSTSQYGV